MDESERAVARVRRVRNGRWLLYRLNDHLRKLVNLIIVEAHRVMLRRARTPDDVAWCARVITVLKAFRDTLDAVTTDGDRILEPGPLPAKIRNRARKRGAAAAATLFTILIASPAPARAAEKPSTSSPAVRLIGDGFLAQGCPIGPTTLLTARHVAAPRSSGSTRRVAAIWQDGSGHMGTAWAEDYDIRRDLAVMRSDVAFERVVGLAAAPPAIGEKLTLFVYDGPLVAKPVSVMVENVVAGHVIVTAKARPGSSGGCVLNTRGELVAIVSGQLDIDGSPFGLTVGVWGPLADVSWTFEESR
jgi:hypothetical protein